MNDRLHEREPPADLFDRERTLVRELTAFVRDCARQESDAIAFRDEGVRAAEGILRRALALAEQERARREEETAGALAADSAQIESKLRAALEESRSKWEARIAAAMERRQRAVERAERECKEAVWLADTVLESGRPRPVAEFDKLSKHLDAGLTKLADLRTLVAELWPSVAMPEDGEADEAPAAPFEELLAEAEDAAVAADRARLARFFRSGLPLVVAPVLGLAAGAAVGFSIGWERWQTAGAVAAAALVASALLMIPLGAKGRREFRDRVGRFSEALSRARAAARAERERGAERRDSEIEVLERRRADDVQGAKRALESVRERLGGESAARRAELERERDGEIGAIEAACARELADVKARAARARDETQAQFRRAVEAVEGGHDESVREAEGRYRSATRALHEDGRRRVAEFRERLGEIERFAAVSCPTWNDRLSGAWRPRPDRRFGVRLGCVGLDLAGEAGAVGDCAGPVLDLLPPMVSLPVALDVAGRGSLLIEAGREGRDEAIQRLQAVLLQLLSTAPPGRAKLTIFDPVGRGRSFAGLMRLADHDESLVGARIWTESRHMEARLTDLTEHIENVIQKYLRDDYASIDEYNRVAGEIAEPYRFLVIADFPTNFSEDASARLASIIDAGARCGVHVMMLVDPADRAPSGFDLEELRKRAVVIEHTGDGFRLADEGLCDLPLELDEPPSEAEAVELLRLVGEGALDAGRVEVRYGVLEPDADRVWTRSCAEELRVPLGRAGATKIQELRLGRGTSQHALVAGKTGSGKSTLLHVLATTAMLWHHPREVELYLVDFKKGVEFKPYASGRLPHVRAVAIESDREFGLSVLQRLDAELRRRGDLFRDHGVQSLANFRERFPEEPMPRSILMIDEFQEFFVEDDRIAQDAALLLDRLVRQGRAFGLHVLLASQTLSGAYTLGRSTMGQMAVRIALKCSETDSYLILSEDNGAARLLTRPGEAIYNDANGLVEGNNPFQVAWLGDDERADVLGRIEARSESSGVAFEEPVFFEGNAAAELERNRLLRRALAEGERPLAAVAWLGEPVSIKAPTGAVMRRRGGANLLIVGQRAETAAAMLVSAGLSLGAQRDHEGPKAARFIVLDGTPEDDPLAGRVGECLSSLPHEVQRVAWRDADSAVAEVHAEVVERERANRTDGPPIYMLVNGLHWLRSLRRKDDDFSFRSEDEAPSPDRQFKTIVLEGPRVGVFVLCWCDTAGSLTRTLDRASIGEFDSRALMQMSANDSSFLIESTAAGKLGLHRAIFFDEESGTEEKFRPYSLPSPGAVERLIREAKGR